MKREIDTERQCSAVICHQIDSSSDMLTTHPSKSAATAAIEAVGNLEERNIWHDFGSQSNDSNIIVENLCVNVLHSHEHSKNNSAEDHAENSGRVCCSGSAFCVACS